MELMNTLSSTNSCWLATCSGPRLLTGAILAHELMHGWLRLKGRFDAQINACLESVFKMKSYF